MKSKHNIQDTFFDETRKTRRLFYNYVVISDNAQRSIADRARSHSDELSLFWCHEMFTSQMGIKLPNGKVHMATVG